MNITPNKPVTMRLFSLPCSLPVVRAALGQMCRMIGFGDASIGGIVISVDEAMANIIKHAYGGAKDKDIDVELLPFEQANGAGVRITLRDYGPGVDPAQIKPRNLEDVVPGGLGVHIMRQNMDRIEYQPADGGGTVLTLVKRLSPAERNRKNMSYDSTHSPIKDVRRTDKAMIVEVVGDIDLNRSHDFQQALLELLEEGPANLIVHLAGVPYMDSSGVASLVKLLSRVKKAGASLHLVGLNDRVRSVFEITRLDTVFDIHNSEEEALA